MFQRLTYPELPFLTWLHVTRFFSSALRLPTAVVLMDYLSVSLPGYMLHSLHKQLVSLVVFLRKLHRFPLVLLFFSEAICMKFPQTLKKVVCGHQNYRFFAILT